MKIFIAFLLPLMTIAAGLRHHTKRVLNHKAKTRSRSIQFNVNLCTYGRNHIVCAGSDVNIEGAYVAIQGH